MATELNETMTDEELLEMLSHGSQSGKDKEIGKESSGSIKYEVSCKEFQTILSKTNSS